MKIKIVMKKLMIIYWNIDLSIITNSGIKLKEREQLYNKNLENIKIIREKEREEDRNIVKLNITKTDNNEVKNELNKKYPNKNKIVMLSCDEYIEENLNNIGNLFD